MSAINEHLGHQIVVYPFSASEDLGIDYKPMMINEVLNMIQTTGAERDSRIIVFRYLIDGKETGLCHLSYREALAAAKLEVETYHGCEVKKESA